MARVIKQSAPPVEAPLWYEGLRIACPCGCVFELEAGDHPTITSEPSSRGKTSVVFPCPVCGKPTLYQTSNGTVEFLKQDRQEKARHAMQPAV